MLTTSIVPGVRYECIPQYPFPDFYFPQFSVSLDFVVNLFWGIKRFRATGSGTYKVSCVPRPYECGGYITIKAYDLTPDPEIPSWDFNFIYGSSRDVCSQFARFFPPLSAYGCYKRVVVGVTGTQDTVLYDPPCFSIGPRVPYPGFQGSKNFAVDFYCGARIGNINDPSKSGVIRNADGGFTIIPIFNFVYDTWIPVGTLNPENSLQEYAAGTIKLITDEGTLEWPVFPTGPYIDYNDCDDTSPEIIPASFNYTLTASREAGDYYY